MTNPRALFVLALRSPLVWTWGLLAIVPPDALAAWMGWDWVDPPYLGTLFVWWGVDAWARLALLAWLLRTLQPAQGLRKPTEILPAALNAEALLSALSGIVALSGLIPAFAVLALLGVEAPWHRVLILGLLGLGLLPAFAYFLRRSLAPVALLQGTVQRGGEALSWSRDRLDGRWKPFLALALPWWALGWTLDALGLALGSIDSWAGTGLAWTLGVPSLLCGLLPLALFVAPDETL